jgi:hypothetical protein
VVGPSNSRASKSRRGIQPAIDKILCPERVSFPMNSESLTLR